MHLTPNGTVDLKETADVPVAVNHLVSLNFNAVRAISRLVLVTTISHLHPAVQLNTAPARSHYLLPRPLPSLPSAISFTASLPPHSLHPYLNPASSAPLHTRLFPIVSR
jgi:hypothetical protein